MRVSLVELCARVIISLLTWQFCGSIWCPFCYRVASQHRFTRYASSKYSVTLHSTQLLGREDPQRLIIRIVLRFRWDMNSLVSRMFALRVQIDRIILFIMELCVMPAVAAMDRCTLLCWVLESRHTTTHASSWRIIFAYFTWHMRRSQGISYFFPVCFLGSNVIIVCRSIQSKKANKMTLWKRMTRSVDGMFIHVRAATTSKVSQIMPLDPSLVSHVSSTIFVSSFLPRKHPSECFSKAKQSRDDVVWCHL